jgi:tetrahydromethanopterin S-methyltransferase subunit G
MGRLKGKIKVKSEPLILFAIVIGIFMGIWGSLQPLSVKAQITPSTSDYWRGTTDQRLTQIESKVDVINKKLDGVCNDMVGVRIEQAKTGIIYGIFSSLGIYLLGTLAQMLFNRRKK